MAPSYVPRTAQSIASTSRSANRAIRPARDPVAGVELPPEIRRPGYCARLRRCLYGTRDAPALWEAFLEKELGKMGCKGVGTPAVTEKELQDEDPLGENENPG